MAHRKITFRKLRGAMAMGKKRVSGAMTAAMPNKKENPKHGSKRFGAMRKRRNAGY